MDDCELLKLAAQAAGMRFQRSRLDDPMHADFLMNGFSPRNKGQTAFPWNPLSDDGDALRLATLLGLSIAMDAQWSDGLYVVVTLNNVQGDAPLTGDRNAAVRRAIVRAAAEIGVLM